MKKSDNMIEFGGIVYYIDLDALDVATRANSFDPNDLITITEKKSFFDSVGNITTSEILETSSLRGNEFMISKYETIKLMLEILMDTEEDSDDALGAERALQKAKLSYKLAFNTLYNYGILKEKE